MGEEENDFAISPGEVRLPSFHGGRVRLLGVPAPKALARKDTLRTGV